MGKYHWALSFITEPAWLYSVQQETHTQPHTRKAHTDWKHTEEKLMLKDKPVMLKDKKQARMNFGSTQQTCIIVIIIV